jgi:hypothetical protein
VKDPLAAQIVARQAGYATELGAVTEGELDEAYDLLAQCERFKQRPRPELLRSLIPGTALWRERRGLVRRYKAQLRRVTELKRAGP